MVEESRKHSREVATSSKAIMPTQKRRIWVPYATPTPPICLPRPAGFLTSPPTPVVSSGGAQTQPRPTTPRPTVTCHKCGQPGHYSTKCPQNLLHPPPRPFTNKKSGMRTVRVNHVKTQEAKESPEVLMGTLIVNSVPAKVLFDSGASHSFISGSFARVNEIKLEGLSVPLIVQSPGSRWRSNKVSQNIEITIGTLPFQASLIALHSSDIDVILGMDWLVANKAVIDCPAKSVKISHPSGRSEERRVGKECRL